MNAESEARQESNFNEIQLGQYTDQQQALLRYLNEEYQRNQSFQRQLAESVRKANPKTIRNHVSQRQKNSIARYFIPERAPSQQSQLAITPSLQPPQKRLDDFEVMLRQQLDLNPDQQVINTSASNYQYLFSKHPAGSEKHAYPKDKAQTANKQREPQINPQMFLGLEISCKDKSEKHVLGLQRALVFKDFLNVLNFSNRLIVSSVQIPGHFTYKAYIGRGNNGTLVRGILKNRWWWTLAESSYDAGDIQLLWTQWRNADFVQHMKQDQQELVVKRISGGLCEGADTAEQPDKGASLPGGAEEQGKQPAKAKDSKPSRPQTCLAKQDTEKLKPNGAHAANLTKLLSEPDFKKLARFAQKTRKSALLSQPYLTDTCQEPETYFQQIDPALELVKYKDPIHYKLHNHIGNNFHLANKNALM